MAVPDEDHTPPPGEGPAGAPQDTWPDRQGGAAPGAAPDTWPDTREQPLARHLFKNTDDSVTTLPPDPLVGKILDGRYEVQAVIGEGGMGIVYQARHTTLGKALAIKVLRSDHLDDNSMRRFKQEAQAASAIGHEHIVDVMDFGTLPDGSTYLVMEYLEGQSLKSALNLSRTPFPLARALHIAKQICTALGEAHGRGVVHRDLKPDNILLVRRGEDQDFVKILDFGIAKVAGAGNTLTRAGQVFGTPHYMAPEQCAGTGADARTDVYALGVILYEMVSGSVPFDAENWMGILSQHLYEQPRRLSQHPLGRHVPESLEAVILKCLAKRPSHRYQTMRELLEDLRQVDAGAVRSRDLGLNVAILAQNTGAWPSQDGAGTSRWRPVVAGAVLALSLVGIGIVLGVMGRWGESAPVTTPVMPSENALPPEPSQDQAPRVVHLDTTPPEAQVLESGLLLGVTPLDLEQPTAGDSRQIELRKPGYVAQRVRIDAQTPDSLQVALSRKRAVRRRGSQPAKQTQPSAGDDLESLREPWPE